MDNKRQKELLKIEQIWLALQGAGVDNWEGFEIAMERIQKLEEREDLIENTIEEILEVAAENCDINPAGPNTGVGFHNSVYEPMELILERFLEKHKDI